MKKKLKHYPLQTSENTVTVPDYKRIFKDMISIRYPDKELLCAAILTKDQLTRMDVIALNNIITGKVDRYRFAENQRLKSYDKQSVFRILKFQKDNRLNNSQLARHFKISRNTITKWKRIFVNNI